MGKYDSLEHFLRRHPRPDVWLSFHDIERIIAAPLPDRALTARWWTTNGYAGRKIQTDAWERAGYVARLYAGRRVKFTRRSDRDAFAPLPASGVCQDLPGKTIG